MKLDVTYNNGKGFAYDLDVTKENSKSIYAVGMYDNKYRIVKATNELFIDGEKVADTCKYQIF